MGIAFALILILMSFMTVMGIARLQDVASATSMMEEATIKERLSQQWVEGIATNTVRTFARIRTENPAEEKELAAEMTAVSADVSRVQKELEPLIHSEEGKKMIALVADQRKTYSAIRDATFKLKAEKGPGPELIAAIETKMTPADVQQASKLLVNAALKNPGIIRAVLLHKIEQVGKSHGSTRKREQ